VREAASLRQVVLLALVFALLADAVSARIRVEQIS
jgi:hypothetical protein